MKTIILSLFTMFLLTSTLEPEVKAEEAKAAFKLLNAIRTNPKAYVKQFPFLSEVAPRRALIWNDTLAKVAERKALDMATRNYFTHVDPDGYGMNYYINKAGYHLPADWLRKPQANYFESCNAGGLTGREAIEMLIVDNGVPTLGHRKHLLGIDEWSATLVDIGIGYVKTSGKTPYASYTCILIAKHR